MFSTIIAFVLLLFHQSQFKLR